MRQSLCRIFTTNIIPPVANEQCKSFAPGTPERELLLSRCKSIRSKAPHVIPIVVDGQRYYPGTPVDVPIPSDNKVVFVKAHHADDTLVDKAIESSLRAHESWSFTPFKVRASIFLKAANLLANSHWRYDILAATMIGQSKNPWQAEIDSVTEAVDFLRFHTKFAEDLYARQPISPPTQNLWNCIDYRPLEGFVTAITPFNFTAIGTNLAATPALMGNTVIWKPSRNSMLANYFTYCLLEEAGLPPGVINFIPCSPSEIQRALVHKYLAGVSFTGSTNTFNHIWQQVSSHLLTYRNYPRLSGETGGKNFHLIHPTADIPSVIACTIRSAFEYQGQKCSACSRLFAPASKWEEIKKGLIQTQGQLKCGQPDDFTSFLCAVIDKLSYDKITKYIEIMKKEGFEIIAGGGYSDEKGYFIEPTIGVTKDLNATTLKDEIFGPVLSVYVYDDSKPDYWKNICDEIDKATTYALTGSIFAQDRQAIGEAQDYLRYASGMLYINDKSTGAVVGQQPFGGARKSGTNDKPGGPGFVEKWVSMRTIKESFDYLPQVSYPHQLPENVVVPDKK